MTFRTTGSSQLAPLIPLSKVHANAMMALFNNRLSINGGRNEVSNTTVAQSADQPPTQLRFDHQQSEALSAEAYYIRA
ncbi:hypothetical protein AMATHDRAFT_69504 [Amanita thiersii Skay4041]|uniref:Uncharacterized protein n=1 Tax=Amanita thiersii Skay4041 TaxID=703135 RepID=A0A2A9N8C7_9AGAR|nr:hypothetical protein AMATHDRAFT_69504 [Amanita thiersii Skay4041]